MYRAVLAPPPAGRTDAADAPPAGRATKPASEHGAPAGSHRWCALLHARHAASTPGAHHGRRGRRRWGRVLRALRMAGLVAAQAGWRGWLRLVPMRRHAGLRAGHRRRPSTTASRRWPSLPRSELSRALPAAMAASALRMLGWRSPRGKHDAAMPERCPVAWHRAWPRRLGESTAPGRGPGVLRPAPRHHRVQVLGLAAGPWLPIGNGVDVHGAASFGFRAVRVEPAGAAAERLHGSPTLAMPAWTLSGDLAGRGRMPSRGPQ